MKKIDILGFAPFFVYVIGLVVSYVLWNDGGQIVLTFIGCMMLAHILLLIHENTKE